MTDAVPYSTTSEYRAVFRKITGHPEPSAPRENPFDIDDETLDESDYDEGCVALFMESVFESTREHPLFQKVYDTAAAQVLSTDRGIGLAILLSFDYLWTFYECYCDYVENPLVFSETNEWYVRLSALLHR